MPCVFYLLSFVSLLATATGFHCDEGFSFWSGQCYCFDYARVEILYQQAVTLCKQLNSHVLSIHSEEENKFVNKNHKVKSVWLGLNKRNGIWKWSDGTPLNYSHWDFSQPNSGSDNKCAKLNCVAKSGKWHDVPCKHEYGVVCKYNPKTRAISGIRVQNMPTTTPSSRNPASTVLPEAMDPPKRITVQAPFGKKSELEFKNFDGSSSEMDILLKLLKEFNEERSKQNGGRKTFAKETSAKKSGISRMVTEMPSREKESIGIFTHTRRTKPPVLKTSVNVNYSQSNFTQTGMSHIATEKPPMERRRKTVGVDLNENYYSTTVMPTSRRSSITNEPIEEKIELKKENEEVTHITKSIGLVEEMFTRTATTLQVNVSTEPKANIPSLLKRNATAVLDTVVDYKPCIPKSFGDNRKVCVCNATYCDTFPLVEEMRLYQAVIFQSSETGKLFDKFSGKFSYRRRQSKALKEVYINVDDRKRYQKLIGFGGTFTDAVGINMNSLTNQTRNTLLESYFASESGLHYTLGSVPIGSNSFSSGIYSYDDEKDDFLLKNFTLTDEDFELKIPYIRQAMELAANKLKLFAIPWSAPAWLKETNDMLLGGPLKNGTKYHQTWANYLLRFLEEYLRNGLPFWALSVQNRPQSGETEPWQRMYYSPEMERNFVEHFLGPTLQKSEAGKKVAVMAFNDIGNLLPQWINEVFGDKNSSEFISGAVVQWYKSNSIVSYKALSEAKRKYPGLFILSTQTSYRHGEPSYGNWTRGELYAQNIIENLLHDVSGWTDFNLCLDLEGGPSLLDTNIDAPILVNSTGDEFYKQPMYYAIAHFSKFLLPGSTRIHTSISNNKEGIMAAAFLTPKKQKAVVITNQGNSQQSLLISDRSMKGRFLEVSLDPHSIATVIWKDNSRLYMLREHVYA